MKKIIIFSLLGLFSFMFSGCNGDETSLTTSTPSTTELETTNEPTTEELVILSDTYFQYSSHSTQNILITNLDISEDYYLTDLDGNELVSNEIIVKNEFYEIRSAYVLTSDEDIIEFYLYYDHYRTLISISVSDKVKPYIISSSILDANGDIDLVFQFELFDGGFRQVTGTNLTTSDYTLSENLLTIKSEFLTSEFESNDTVTIDYVLDSSGIVIGFININKE